MHSRPQHSTCCATSQQQWWVNKRRRNAMKDLIRFIEQEAYEYSDPITQFLECLFVRYDFEGAQVRRSTHL